MSGLGLNGQLHDIIDANVKAQLPDSSVLYAAYLDDVMLQQVAQHPVQGSSAGQAWEVFGTGSIGRWSPAVFTTGYLPGKTP